MNLLELQNKIHAQNVQMGWWDEVRPFSTFVCLFHSELSEAMEGDRKGLMDDHLPKYEMFWVELADFSIRCLDWLGSKKFNSDEYVASVAGINECKNDCLAFLHCILSDSFRARHSDDVVCQHLFAAINASFAFASANNIDLEKIILEKVEYNKHRADHKRENRAKEGGKKY